MDRYSITTASYNLFSRKINLSSIEDIPIFLHEFCHQFHNSSTIISGERFNLLIQLLSHISRLSSLNSFKVPLNKWHENIDSYPEKNNKSISAVLENIWEHQSIWLYLDKHNYQPLLLEDFKSNEIINKLIGVKNEQEFDSKTPYLFCKKSNQTIGVAIGGFQLMESAAFALEQLHKKNIDKSIIKKYIDQGKFEYVIVLDYVSNYINDFRHACLFTFLLCDLSMCLSMPSIGFLVLCLEIPKFLKKDLSVIDFLKWYKIKYIENIDDIKNGYSLELAMIRSTRENLLGIDEYIDLIFDYEIKLLEYGFSNTKVDKRLEYLSLLIKARDNEDITQLLKHYPLTIIEDEKNIYYENESQKIIYDLLNAANILYLGLCKNFNVILNNEIILRHFKKIEDNKYLIQVIENNKESDEFGYWLNLLGLNNKEIVNIDNTNSEIIFIKKDETQL